MFLRISWGSTSYPYPFIIPSIDDILADSDSDLPEDMEAEDENGAASAAAGKKRNKTKQKSTYIREDPDEIVDLADLKSIGNVLSESRHRIRCVLLSNSHYPSASGSGQSAATIKSLKAKPQLPNGGFKTADDGRLIISDKALRGQGGGDDSSSDSDASMDDDGDDNKEPKAKRGMEEDSSDEEEVQKQQSVGGKRKRKATDALSMRSGKTTASSRYTAGGKGIHRQLGAGGGGGGASDAMSVKSGKSTARPAGSEYGSKKAKGDMKKRGQLDPYAYIPLSRNNLNKRWVFLTLLF